MDILLCKGSLNQTFFYPRIVRGSKTTFASMAELQRNILLAQGAHDFVILGRGSSGYFKLKFDFLCAFLLGKTLNSALVLLR